jgi:hypothetical protein
VTGLLAVAVLVSLPFLYNAAQRELAPGEDQAMVLTVIKSPQHANIDYVEKFGKKWDEVLAALPENTGRWLINGSDGVSNSIGGVQLSDWKDRKRSADQVQGDVQGGMNDVEGSSVFAFQLPSLPGSTGGLPVQMVIRSAGDHRVVFEAMEALKKAARDSGKFAVVDSDLEFNNPVTEVRVDRAKANSMGVTMKSIGDTLAVLVGENYVNRFGMDGRSYDVIPQSPRDQRLSAEALSRYFVKSASGQPVPLANLVSLSTSVGPNKLTQFNQLNASTFQAIPMPGVTMGDAVAFLSEEAKKLPAGFSYDWQSDARQFTQEGSALVMAFVFAIVVIYLVLAAQYESLRDPLIILISVPMSICGALVPLAMGFGTINIYTQIGLVTLIGLISKHGILMVEFANEIQSAQGPRPSPRHRAGRTHPAAPDPDDHGRDGDGPGAAAVRQRRGRQQPLQHRPGDRGRHAGGHAVHAVRAAHHVHAAGARPPPGGSLAARHRTPRSWRAAVRRRMTMNKTPFLRRALRAGVLVLAGCAVGPTYTAPVDAPVAISAPERSLFANDAVQRDWWRQLDDAQLDALSNGPWPATTTSASRRPGCWKPAPCRPRPSSTACPSSRWAPARHAALPKATARSPMRARWRRAAAQASTPRGKSTCSAACSGSTKRPPRAPRPARPTWNRCASWPWPSWPATTTRCAAPSSASP